LAHNVLAGLATAFSRVGNLKDFLSLWLDQLARSWDHDFRPANKQDLWASKHLHIGVTRLIRESLPPAQLKKIFKKYSGLIDSLALEISASDENAAIETLEGWKLALPALVILEAMLEAANEDQMLRNSTKVLRKLSLNLQSFIELVTPFPNLERRLWRVLPKVQKILFQAEDTKTIVSQVHQLSESLYPRAMSLMDSGPIELSCQAFLFMLVVFQPVWDMGEARRMIQARINGMCAKLAANCTSILSPESGDLRLVQVKDWFDILDAVQVKIALLAMHPYSLV
jgi:hypothetical protein